jgi:hypothetical protein
MKTYGQIQYCEEREIAQTFENQYLYRMCIDAPNHNDTYKTAGKLIAVSRIYSASPARGAGKRSISGPSFFDYLAKSLDASELDSPGMTFCRRIF